MRDIPEPVVAFLIGLMLGPTILIAVGATPRHANTAFERDAIAHGYAHYYVNPTNSAKNTKLADRITELDVSMVFAKAINNIHNNESVSELFV